MNTYKILGVVFCGILICGTEIPLAHAANRPMNYQGLLTDSTTGSPFNGIKGFQFIVHNGSNGPVQWESPCTDITISNGVVRATLGPGGAWDTLNWSAIDAYLEVVVGDPSSCANPVSLAPQERILASAYSLSGGGSGGSASNGSWSLNGTSLSYIGGKVGIGTSTPGEELEVNGNIRMSDNSGNYEQYTAMGWKDVLKVFRGGKNVWNLSDDGTGKIGFYGANANAFSFKIDPTAPDGSFSMAGTGNIGIGTAAASDPLTVSGYVASIGPSGGMRAYDRTGDGSSSIFYRHSGYTSLWDSTLGNVMTYDHLGNVSTTANLFVGGTVIGAVNASNGFTLPILPPGQSAPAGVQNGQMWMVQ